RHHDRAQNLRRQVASIVVARHAVPTPKAGGSMQHQLKSISKAGIAEALAKVELYRYLNEPEEAESICRDILAVDPEHQLAKRMLGLSITDQFLGTSTDRHAEAAELFAGLRDPYEHSYYMGLLQERRAKSQLRIGVGAHILLP